MLLIILAITVLILVYRRWFPGSCNRIVHADSSTNSSDEFQSTDTRLEEEEDVYGNEEDWTDNNKWIDRPGTAGRIKV